MKLKTNRDFLSYIIQKSEFLHGEYSTSFIADNYADGFDPYMTEVKDKTKAIVITITPANKYVCLLESVFIILFEL